MIAVNPNIFFHSAKELSQYPHFVSAESAIKLSQFDHILWVKHQVSGVYWPWLMETQDRALVDKLETDWKQLSAVERIRATRMGLLHETDDIGVKRLVFQSALISCRESVKKTGWCLVPSICFPTYFETINQYVENNTRFSQDDQVVLRKAEHNSPLFQAVHRQITDIIQAVADESIKPSYCYLGHYSQDAVLHKHTDRQQCRWNASITFARTHDIWPIFVEGADGDATAIKADLGEVVIYRGTDVPHWRDALPAGTATVCFFHFIPCDFVGERN